MRHWGCGQDGSVVSERFELFVGIDWAAESHEVCVLDAERRVIDRKTVEHRGAGVAQLCDLLLKLSNHQPSRVAEGRGWRGFHHHATLCIAAYGFLVAERSRFSPSARSGKLRLRTPKFPLDFKPRGSPRPGRAA